MPPRRTSLYQCSTKTFNKLLSFILLNYVCLCRNRVKYIYIIYQQSQALNMTVRIMATCSLDHQSRTKAGALSHTSAHILNRAWLYVKVFRKIIVTWDIIQSLVWQWLNKWVPSLVSAHLWTTQLLLQYLQRRVFCIEPRLQPWLSH